MDGQVSPPVVLDEGTMVFLDCGRLQAVGDDLKVCTLKKLVGILPRDSWLYTCKLFLEGNRLDVRLSKRGENAPFEKTYQRWVIELGIPP